jgi:hypothetical protein
MGDPSIAFTVVRVRSISRESRKQRRVKERRCCASCPSDSGHGEPHRLLNKATLDRQVKVGEEEEKMACEHGNSPKVCKKCKSKAVSQARPIPKSVQEARAGLIPSEETDALRPISHEPRLARIEAK